jgi:hypothetical protein
VQPDFRFEILLEPLAMDEDREAAPQLGDGHVAVRRIRAMARATRW